MKATVEQLRDVVALFELAQLNWELAAADLKDSGRELATAVEKLEKARELLREAMEEYG